MSDDRNDDWHDVWLALTRFGLPAQPEHRDAILTVLNEQIVLEANGEADLFLMRLLCAQLFSIGRVEDSLAVWRAKSCSFDAHCEIDVQLEVLPI
jgi:hypothetical protein